MNNIRYKALKAVYKKEMLDILRDKRTLVVMVLLPLILYPLIMIAVSQASMIMMESRDSKVLAVAFAFEPDARLQTLISERQDKYKITVSHPDDPAAAFAAHEIMSYATQETVDGKTVYKVYYNSSQADTVTASDRIRDILDDYKELLISDYLAAAGLDAEAVLEPVAYTGVNIAGNEQKTGSFLGSILPFLLITALVTGAVYPAIDVTAGEKERGTMETLLTLPVSNSELMGGKYLAVAGVAVVSAILNFVSMTLVGVFILNSLTQGMSDGAEAFDVNLGSMILPFSLILICIIVFALFVSAVVLCVTSLARSFKEANNYMMPVLFVFMLPAMATIVPDVSLTARTAVIPVMNIALLIRDALVFNYDALNIAVVLASNIGYALVAFTVLSRIYNSESILFGSGVELNFLERRSHILPGSRISSGDGLILYVVGLLCLFYLSSFFTQQFGYYGIAATQCVLLALPVLAAVYLKADLVHTFKLTVPRATDVLGGLVLWFGAFILANLAGMLLLYLFPQNEEVVSKLANILKGDNYWMTLLIVALLPAICEELFFRGFIFSSLEGAFRTGSAVILTGLMFAIYHMDFIRLAPTFILGVLFTLALARTRSIVVPSLMHFVNNGLAVTVLFYPALENYNPVRYITQNTMLEIVIYLLVAVVCIGAGMRVLRRRTGREISSTNFD